MITRADINGCPNIGLFAVANNQHAVVSALAPKSFSDLVREVLDVDIVRATVDETGLIGLFCAANSKKAYVPKTILPEEQKVFEEVFSDVIVIDSKYTAVGNLLALNDNGMIVSKYLSKEVSEAKEMSIAGSDLVGSAIFVNNKGLLVHPGATDQKLAELEKTFKVKGDVGTVNFGDQFVKSGILANDKGVLVGSATTGPEIMRVDEIFEE